MATVKSFSGAVRLKDVSDFIAPSQACVVSLEPKKDGGEGEGWF